MSTDKGLRYIRQGHTCYYCKGHTHFIDPDSYPNDAYAKEVEPNKWMCGNCIDNAEENTVLRTADPTSPRYQQVLAKRQAAPLSLCDDCLIDQYHNSKDKKMVEINNDN